MQKYVFVIICIIPLVDFIEVVYSINGKSGKRVIIFQRKNRVKSKGVFESESESESITTLIFYAYG
jgi:hypothetical protein